VKPAKVAVFVSSNCSQVEPLCEDLILTMPLQQTAREVEDLLNVETAQQRSLAEALGASKLAISRVQGPLALDEACHLAEQALGGLAGVDRRCSPCPR